jgi:hypothetical protein
VRDALRSSLLSAFQKVCQPLVRGLKISREVTCRLLPETEEGRGRKKGSWRFRRCRDVCEGQEQDNSRLDETADRENMQLDLNLVIEIHYTLLFFILLARSQGDFIAATRP